MKTNVRFSIFALALLLCLGCFAACKPKTPPAQDTTQPTVNTQAPSSTIPEYAYPDLDCEGEIITIRGLSWLWDMYIFLDGDNTGDKLDREIYNRNIGIEQRFNCEIEVDEFQWNWSMEEYINNIQNAVSTDMNAWDIIYIPLNERPDLITMGYFHDLKTVDELALDSPWWDGSLNQSFELVGSLYSASSPMQLQAFDSAWAIFFNETLVRNHEGMPNPRDLFNSNEWTLEKLGELCQTGAYLNGSESFIFSQGNGNQVYGLSSHPLLPDKLLYAAGERYVVNNEITGTPEFRADQESFGDVVYTLSQILGKENNLKASSNDMSEREDDFLYGPTCGYVYAFANNHAFFMGAEIKTSRVIKNYDIDISYGIVPLPKKNSAQTEYYTPVVETLLTFTIPVTCSNVEMVAQIADAMSYESYRNVLPIYYDQLLHRGYTEADEPIMDVLNNSRGVDMAYYYGWNDALADHVQERVFAGSGDISSGLATQKDLIETSIREWIEDFSKLSSKNDAA